MLTDHDYAFQIKVTLDSIFEYSSKDLGGLANTEFIEINPFISMTLILGHFYNKVDLGFKNKIDRFFNSHREYIGMSISEIGNEKIEEILEEFKRIVSTI